MKLDGPEQAKLRDLFADLFVIAELRTLCLKLNLPYEDVPGETRTEKIQELIAMMNRFGRVEELLNEAKQMRPSADWSAIVPAQENALFPIHEISYPANPNFTGRVALLKKIEQTLGSGQTAVVTQAIAGLGGVGKTQLALAYCYTHLNNYDLIFWLAADNEASLTDSFRNLGQRLKLATLADTDQKAIVQRVLLWLSQSEQRWLLVFDNADQIEPKELANYLPRTGSGQVLITSRNPNWRSVGSVLELNIFSEDEAETFLKHRAGATTEENVAEKNLANALGYFPLALEHAAAYVEATGSNYATYQQLFETMRQDLWAELEEPSSYNATITTTWELAFKQVKEVAGAIDLLNLCCFMAPDEIPLDLIVEHADTLPTELAEILGHPLNRDKAISGLLRYSLIQRKGNELSIHRLVQMVSRDRMSESLSQLWSQTVVSLLSAAFIYDEYDMGTWSTSQRLLSHNQEIAGWSPETIVLPEKTVSLLNKTAQYFAYIGSYEASQTCTQRALTISEEQLGKNHTDTAQSLNNMGHLLQVMGDLTAAQPYYERALAIRENVLGPDHPDTAESLDNLGTLLHSLGDLTAAKPFFERAFTIREKTLGSDHPHTAYSLNNLGGLLQAIGDPTTARSYYDRALVIRETALGPDHPDTAVSAQNLGVLLHKAGDLSAARPHFEHAFAIREKAFGPNHPHTAGSLDSLGSLFQAMGDTTAAQPFHERALAIREKYLGADHPETAESLNNLGSIYLLQGKLIPAYKSFERALKIIEETKGENHPVLVNILTNLSGIMVNLKKEHQARKYLKRAKDICRNAPVTYAECLETEELWKMLPGQVGKPKNKKKKRRR